MAFQSFLRKLCSFLTLLLLSLVLYIFLNVKYNGFILGSMWILGYNSDCISEFLSSKFKIRPCWWPQRALTIGQLERVYNLLELPQQFVVYEILGGNLCLGQKPNLLRDGFYLLKYSHIIINVAKRGKFMKYLCYKDAITFYLFVTFKSLCN